MMKRGLAIILSLLIMLSGCSGQHTLVERAVQLRQKIQNASGYAFTATVTADYGDKIYVFKMDCQADDSGDLSFCVTEPTSIAGVSGVVEENQGKITFDDKALMFELIADGYISPISAPWFFMRTLSSGYIQGCEDYERGLHIQIDDSYADDALRMEIWTDKSDIPLQGEIVWQGRRILSVVVDNFTFL